MNSATDSHQETMHIKSGGACSLLELTLLATAVAGLLYFEYFNLAPWIWSQSIPFKPEDLTFWRLDFIKEQDGIELYALYVLMFLNLLCVYALSCVWNRLASNMVRYLIALLLVAVVCVFIDSIGFHPPMSTIANHAAPDNFIRSLATITVILPILLLLSYLQRRSVRLALTVAALLLIPVCFIAFNEQFSWYDYGYILAPALRLFHGTNVSEIYFQYDLLPSFIGLAWLKLRLDPNLFYIVAQGTFYLLLLGLFAFSRRWFMDKRLAVFLLAALVLVRMYAGLTDAANTFQTTPIRLDMWLILLLLVYFKGPHHWSAGLFCGLMLLLHHNFGIIYSAAYLQLLLTLCVIDTAWLPGGLLKPVANAAVIFFKRNYPNFALILMGALAHYLLFRNTDIQGDFSYVHLGLGFIKIAADSFYWYVVVILGLSFMLLLRLRPIISRSYMVSGLCLIYLAIGNSLYFFGRSHENNILNISTILLLLFFLLLDIALLSASGKPEKPFLQRNLAIVISFAFIASITIWYGDKITARVAIQAKNIGKGQFVYPPEILKKDVMSVIAEVKSVTGNNPKVYFVDANDFLYYYYGGYAQVGYYVPTDAWSSRREYSKFLQGLLDEGYYLVMSDDVALDVLPSVRFSNKKFIEQYVLVAWK